MKISILRDTTFVKYVDKLITYTDMYSGTYFHLIRLNLW